MTLGTRGTSPTRRVSHVIIISSSSKEGPAGQRPAKCHICPAKACRRSVLTALRCHRLPLLCQYIIKYPSQERRTITTVILSPEFLASSRQWAHHHCLEESVCPRVFGKITECNLDLFLASSPSAHSPRRFSPLCLFSFKMLEIHLWSERGVKERSASPTLFFWLQAKILETSMEG